MILAGVGRTDLPLTDEEVFETLRSGLKQADLSGKKIIVLTPDHTRTCPLPQLYRFIIDIIGNKVKQLDFLIALGTHQPLPKDKIDKLFGLGSECPEKYKQYNIYNHLWENPDTFTTLGTIPADEIEKITKGLMREDVPVGLNKMILDYDEIVILGPTFPHEVVGFSGGLKYLFPGIADWKIINFFHWLGAVITCIRIIGHKDTPVREVLNKAAEFVPVPILNIDLVVKEGNLIGVYIGDAKDAFSQAADLSEKTHIVYKDKPYRTVLGIAPEMYDDIWTAGKVMYKLEPIVADGGELIIYAPHIDEISYTHGKIIDKIGYHVRDYFLKQMDKFKDIPGGVMAHSTHVRGLGEFENGIEKPRITVTLATKIPEERTRKVNLNYRAPDSINIDEYRNREEEGVLVVEHAGEVLHRLKDESQITIPE